jgi:hypothetical protein
MPRPERGRKASGGASADREARRQALLNRQRESQKAGQSGPGFFEEGLNVKFWKCDEGDHILDIIPYYAGPNDPDAEEGEFTYGLYVYEHRDVGGEEGKSYICLDRTYGEDCPICEHRRQLEKQGGDEDLIKSLRPSKYPRTIYNIISYDGNEEAKGIQVWHTSYFLFEMHLNKLAVDPRRKGTKNENIILFADPEEGKSIAFTRQGTGINTKYLAHRFLDRDYVIEDGVIEQANKLDELIHIPTYEELYEAYWGEPFDEEAAAERSKPKRPGKKLRTRAEAAAEPEPEPEQEEPEEKPARTSRPARKPKREPEPEPEPEEPEEPEGPEELECPHRGEFAVDFNTLKACDDCEIWDECSEANEAMEEEKPKKPDKKPEKKASLSRRRR